MASAADLFKVRMVSTAIFIILSLAEPRLIAVDIIPVPNGLVNINKSPGRINRKVGRRNKKLTMIRPNRKTKIAKPLLIKLLADS